MSWGSCCRRIRGDVSLCLGVEPCYLDEDGACRLSSNGIEFREDELAEFCREYHVSRLSLFGSVLREDFGPDSDVDVLVEFEPGYVPGFFQLARMEEDLSELLGGRKADLRTPRDLSRYFRDEVLASAVVQYERA